MASVMRNTAMFARKYGDAVVSQMGLVIVADGWPQMHQSTREHLERYLPLVTRSQHASVSARDKPTGPGTGESVAPQKDKGAV